MSKNKTGVIAKFKYEGGDVKLLLRNIPGIVPVLLVVSVVLMNLFANKVMFRQNDFLAADCGFLLSWIPFLIMDIVTKCYGPKAATKLNIMAVLINLAIVAMCAIVAAIPGDGNDYSAFNQTFSSTWFIVFGSTIANIVSSIVNNFTNHSIGRMFKRNPDGWVAYMSRTYISTFIAQFVDNMLFAFIVFRVFAPVYWEGFAPFTLWVCVGSGVLGAVMELAMEVIFSPVGYRICKKWKVEGVGKQYIDLHQGEV